MTQSKIDLSGRLCPFIVMHILRSAGRMEKGERASFFVDDPLAIKSVPEELEERGEFVVQVNKEKAGWVITVSR